MKTVGITIIVILILIVLYLVSVRNSFKVAFKISDVQLKNFTLDLLNSGQSIVQIQLVFVVFFKALFNIVISNLYLEIYYNNQLVAKSSNVPENYKKIILLPNVDNLVYQTFDLKVNAQAIDLIYKIKAKQPYSVNYKLSAKVFGIQVSQNKIYNS